MEDLHIRSPSLHAVPRRLDTLYTSGQRADGKREKDLADETRDHYIPDFSNWKDHDSFETGNCSMP